MFINRKKKGKCFNKNNANTHYEVMSRKALNVCMPFSAMQVCLSYLILQSWEDLVLPDRKRKKKDEGREPFIFKC